MSLTAIDAEDRASQLTQLTERLADRLAGETLAFESHRPHDAAQGIAETQRLANLYRHEAARVKADPGVLKGTSELTRKRLVRATEAFEQVLMRHGRAVTAAKVVSEGLVRAIAEEVARSRTAVASYGALGRTAPADAAAIALNRRA